ncbi:MAG TPA: ribulose-phosphate 3-epimerase [Clostridiales bacterium]|jgi:ribulose-phosphate 3-epimerase|nr:ribulose-phosphate 3-epimerase [Clostridiales bacterium]
MTGKISASLMCVDFANIRDSIRALEAAGVEYLHIDIMDGKFVPNFTLGPDFVRSIRNMTDIPCDIHLMVWEPERHITSFAPREGDIVSVHAESTVHLQRTLQMIRDTGAHAAIALNPATPLYSMDFVVDDLDVVLVMTVNPGYAGQKLVPASLQKIGDTRRYLNEHGSAALIEVDGNVSVENAIRMREQGADIFVAGTSSLFMENQSLLENAKALRHAIS